MKKLLLFIIALFTVIILPGCSSGNSDSPVFSGYFIEEERVDLDFDFNKKDSKVNIKSRKKDDYFEIGTSIITDEMFVNEGEYVFVTLQFINEARDTFVDLLLNDSVYGKDKVYDNFSKLNKVHSVETYRLNDKWVSDITIVLPGTKEKGVRTIEIKEVNFLKQTINKQIAADLKSQSFSTILNIHTADNYVPTSKYLFDYKEVTYDDITGYEITKFNYYTEYDYPSIVYFPSYINGIPVISIGYNIIGDEEVECKVCVVPETVKFYHTMLLNDVVGTVTDELYILTHSLSDIGEFHYSWFVNGNPIYYMWDDFEHEFRDEGYIRDQGDKKIGYNTYSNGSTKRVSLNDGREYTYEDFMKFELTDDGQGYTLVRCGVENVEEIIIPSEYKGLPVLHIGDHAFVDCYGLRSITLPDNLISIGDYAFANCGQLSSITLSNSLTTIGDYAFSGCHELRSIDIPNSVTSIGDYAFANCGQLSSITLSNSLTTIGDYAFSGCHELRSIDIPNSVTSIGDYAFSGCHELRSIVIPNSVTSMGKCVFYECYFYDVGIYCEADSEPEGWDENWNFKLISTTWEEEGEHEVYEYVEHVYWANEWEYINGEPTPKNN